MEPNQELLTYIKARRDQGAVFPDIENELKGVGWNQIDIDVAIKTLEVSIVPVQESVPEKKEEAAEEPIVDATPMVPETPSQVAEPVEELKKTVKTHEAALILILITVIVAVVGFSLWWYLTHRTPVEQKVKNIATTTSVLNIHTENASTTVIVENATSTKKELPKEYVVKADGVYLDGIIIQGADPKTFEYVSGHYYSKDKPFVYNMIFLSQGAGDLATLQHMNDSYTKDKTNVYFGGTILQNAHPTNFQSLGNGYAKDESHVYFGSAIVQDADLATFENINEFYSKDKNNVYYWNGVVRGADPVTSKYIGRDYIKDKEHVYFRSVIFQNADVSTFQYINDSYTKDKNNVYYLNGIVKGADPANCTAENLKGCEPVR